MPYNTNNNTELLKEHPDTQFNTRVVSERKKKRQEYLNSLMMKILGTNSSSIAKLKNEIEEELQKNPEKNYIQLLETVKKCNQDAFATPQKVFMALLHVVHANNERDPIMWLQQENNNIAIKQNKRCYLFLYTGAT